MILKEIKFLLTHSSIYGLGTIVSQLVAFFLLPLYTRYLTPADYGVLETVGISNGLIGIVVTVGIAMALSRFYYEPEDISERNKVVSTTYITYVFFALLFFPLLYSICSPLSKILFDTDKYAYYFKISLSALLIGGTVDIGMMYLRLIKKPVFFITVTITRLILLIAFNILFIVYFKLGILGILYSSLIVRSLYALLITISILWKIKIKFNLKIAIEMLKYSLPIIPSRLANSLVKQSDKYFVLYFISIADMGLYSLALKLGNAVHSLLTIPFNLSYIPRRFEIMKRHEAKEVYAKIFTYYIFFIGYVGLFISVLIPEILELMVTPEFYRAGEIIPLVVLSMIIFGTHNHFNFGILYSKKTQYLAYINLFSALTSLVVNFFLIKAYGIWGAVVSSIIVLSLQAFLLYYTSNRLYPIQFQFRRIFGFLLFSIVFFITFSQIRLDSKYLDLSLRIFALMTFPVLLMVVKVITKDEIQQLKMIFERKIRLIISRKTVGHT
jgi:O-antigen/teichoic acid export membrane protein